MMSNKMNHKTTQQQRGFVLVSILFIIVFLSTVIYALIVLANSNVARSRSRILLLQAQYAAESGADAAIATLNGGNETYSGTSSDVTLLTNGRLYKATYSVSVAAGADSKEKVLTAVGRVYAPATAAQPLYTRTIKVWVNRTSSTTASSITSRNILETASSVKSIQGTDIYINGYINMTKNTTDLIAENITVADKNTGASNCSIGGTGNLVKPSTFTNPGQTKTRIITAYNNCINPPGNTSNANFDVLVNQTNVSKIQSMYIPWSQYMDSSYQNSPTGCTDWTTGAFPRDIPSTGNTKKTHYPDSSSNISTSCGASGDLALGSGQYNIKDHVHIRANLCASSACNVTFNNPDATIKFIFIEGTINFNNVTTSSGSGPLVFVAYGADPASKVSVCPLGGAVYLGQNGSNSTSAPAAFFLAQNGLCIDKVKFGSSKALGGVGGKNIYVSSNSGTPFDLALDPTFPVNQIPIDLAWKASRYQRL